MKLQLKYFTNPHDDKSDDKFTGQQLDRFKLLCHHGKKRRNIHNRGIRTTTNSSSLIHCKQLFKSFIVRFIII